MKSWARGRGQAAGVLLAAAMIWGLLGIPNGSAERKERKGSERMIGIYVHQHWPYNHPYAARTWTLEDWRGYVGGLRELGYNTILVWPVLETMPKPLTESDRASLDKIGKVIDIVHKEFDMRIYIALCPNVVADSAVAGQTTFQERHFFHSDLRVNPADREAVDQMIRWREELFRPLAKVDGVSIIDSDPGGYPGSTNEEFVGLLAEHRRMFDRLRPGIELVYWMHAGWPCYCRFYETGEFVLGRKEEFQDTVQRLSLLNPEPWGLAGGRWHEEMLPGFESRFIGLQYGAIEGEPSFPMTNFGADHAYKAGGGGSERGVWGNAQSHCLQLPNTFAFARGSLSQPVAEADYVQFADDLIPGQGAMIVEAWKALAGPDAEAMRAVATHLEAVASERLKPGRLKGLLFGNPQRFITDLAMQLRLRAAYLDFYKDSESNLGVRDSFIEFVKAMEVWQQQHGYKNYWMWPGLDDLLKKLNSPEIDQALNPALDAKTPLGRVKEEFYKKETFTPRLIEAMKSALREMD